MIFCCCPDENPSPLPECPTTLSLSLLLPIRTLSSISLFSPSTSLSSLAAACCAAFSSAPWSPGMFLLISPFFSSILSVFFDPLQPSFLFSLLLLSLVLSALSSLALQSSLLAQVFFLLPAPLCTCFIFFWVVSICCNLIVLFVLWVCWKRSLYVASTRRDKIVYIGISPHPAYAGNIWELLLLLLLL